jgi:hypothetical protein
MAVEINMKMPQNCSVCALRSTHKEGDKLVSYCSVNEKKILNTDRRSSSCPLKVK